MRRSAPWILAIAAVLVAAQASAGDPKPLDARVADLEASNADLLKRVAALEAKVGVAPAPAPAVPPPPAPGSTPKPTQWTMQPIHTAALQKVARAIRLGYSVRGQLDGASLAALNEIPWEGSTTLLWLASFAAKQCDPEAGSTNEPALWKAFAEDIDKGDLSAAVAQERKFVKMHVRKGRVLLGDRDAGPWGE